ncbi:MAG: single-stranded-DNA-specific exonuclease RecJ [Deltaproteobacteria bacterium]|nr:single-stranded-DNA-specific exonuclease RecJ [Deltaproteobacteria bacterium]
MEKRWVQRHVDEDVRRLLMREINLSPVTAGVLAGRGICTPALAESFLYPSLHHLRPPEILKGIPAAAARIIEGIERKEKILIFGDYDVDGVSGTALLLRFFHELGARVAYRLPHRQREGYGLSLQCIEDAVQQDFRLLITVDCGLGNHREAARAKEMGLSLIITDHHELPSTLPDADAVIHPDLASDPEGYRHLSGVGVAFLLITALRAVLRERGFWRGRKEPNLKEYLDLVALGIIADVAPLIGANRILVAHGLEVLGRNDRPGLAALKVVSDIRGPDISAGIVGYRLAPRINAAGRMGSADEGLRLLLTQNTGEAESLAKRLDRENRRRQEIEEQILKEAEAMMEPPPGPIILASPGWHVGVIGIVASRLVDSHYRPAILLNIRDGVAQGSARSVEGFHLCRGLEACRDVLIRYGGHQYAAGLALHEEQLPRFRRMFHRVVEEHLRPEEIIPLLRTDELLSPGQITRELLSEMSRLAPFGPGNPEPAFVSTPLEVVSVKRLRHNHLRLRVREEGRFYDAIGFSMGEEESRIKSPIQLAFMPEINRWQGTERLQLRIRDFRCL